jgi:hypothetical protein
MKNKRNKESFEQKQKEFFRQFWLNHPKELATLNDGNLDRPENKNIFGHLQTAGAIADLMCNLLGVDGDDKDAVVSAVTIHDSDKLKEKAFLAEVTNRKTPNYKDLEEYKEKRMRELKEEGYSDRVIDLSEENITHEQGGPKTLPEMISFYTDAMLISAKIVDIKMRFHLTREGWHGGKEQFDEELRRKNLEYSQNFFSGAPGHDGKPHFDIQEEVASRISRAFLEILAKKDPKIFEDYPYLEEEPEKLPYYFEDKLKERILNLKVSQNIK